jgi:alpha-glucuronidase
MHQAAAPMLDHWYNLDRTVERATPDLLWNWNQLPQSIRGSSIMPARTPPLASTAGAEQRQRRCAQSNHEYLLDAAAIADAWRPYGIQAYLTARFSAPKRSVASPADPLDPQVQAWWHAKAVEIYRLISTSAASS